MLETINLLYPNGAVGHPAGCALDLLLFPFFDSDGQLSWCWLRPFRMSRFGERLLCAALLLLLLRHSGLLINRRPIISTLFFPLMNWFTTVRRALSAI